MRAVLIVLMFAIAFIVLFVSYYVFVPLAKIIRHNKRHHVKWRYKLSEDVIIIILPEKKKFFGVRGVAEAFVDALDDYHWRGLLWWVYDCYIYCYDEMLRRGIKND